MKMRMVLLSVVLVFLLGWPVGILGHDYGQALSKSILFYEAQRSGPLPRNQRVSWRSHSGLNDGKASGVDLVGGYYDAGDNVKFGLPMAFTTTMMCWSVIEYGRQMRSQGELNHAISAIKWGTDYFIKAHPQPNVLYGEVGDGKTDHYCWQRPEDMTTDRSAYRIDPSRPGSDLAGETAAAMAAASIVFRRRNRKYSAILLTHARQLFSFADRYRGKYDSSITVAQKYYRSVSGYNDELLWAAAWLYKATKEQYYLNYLAINADIMGGTGWAMTEFSWDVKYAGVQILISKFLMSGKAGHHAPTFRRYQDKAKFFICSMLGKSNKNVRKTPSGLIYKQSWNNMQFVTSASFLLTIYSDYLNSARAKTMTCPTTNIRVYPTELLTMAKSQVDYILGDNPRATSYMVGYGSNYPRQVHHRGASIVSIKEDSKFVSCRGGYATWFSRKMSDPNVLMGAIVGGPDAYDNYADQRDNYEQSEPATYNNAPLMGVLARLGGGHTGYNQLATGDDDSDAAVVRSPPPPPKTSPPPRRVRAPVRKPTSPVTITQRSTTSWRSKGRTYHRYSVIINNKSFKTLKNPQIRINRLYGPLWGLHEHNKFYSLPSGSLPARQSFQFVYIHAASPALISVSGYTLV